MISLLHSLKRRALIVLEVLSFLRGRRAIWLLIAFAGLLAAILFVVASQPEVAPFVHTLF